MDKEGIKKELATVTINEQSVFY